MPQVYLAVALTTLATLLLELSLTRIFSVVFYYHFAFLAISVALFGLGAGGVFSYALASGGKRVFSRLGLASALNAVLAPLSLAVILAQREEPAGFGLALIYFTTSLPFVVAGTILSLVIAETIERVHKVYFFDLLGAAGACLLLIPLLNAFGGPNTAIASGVLFAAAGAIWHTAGGGTRGRAASVALGLLLVGAIVANSRYRFLDIRYAKGQKLEHEKFVKWNSFSRIALGAEKRSGAPMIYIDADASTGVAAFDFDHLSEADRRGLLQSGAGLPYWLRPGARTLIIGPGGGWDVARALASGSRDVTGVEINPIIARTIMQERFAGLSRRLYFRPEVRIVVEDGRSFVRRSRERYGVIQATLVDTWAATAAGAFALSENNLYTTEAFAEYLSRLESNGIAAFTRWGLDPPRESLRIVSLAMAALERMGAREAWRHVIVGREGTPADLAGWGTLDTVLMAREPFSASDIERAREALAAARMETVHLPGERRPNVFSELLHSRDPRAFERAYRFDISPVTDNRPFFFYTVQPRDLWNFLTGASRASADYKINRAVPLLFGVFGVSLLAVAVMLVLPPLVLRARLPRGGEALGLLTYFVFIGTGYILIEVALIQKFVLFLGHPTYALTVVIFSMLVSSGVGSYFSQRARRIWPVLLLIPVAVLALAAAVAALVPAGVGLPLGWKIAAAVALIAPVGFLMGVPFPAGLRRLEQRRPEAVRWAWSLNAAASVVGSAGALVCGIYFGLLETLVCGAALYGAALILFRHAHRSAVTLREGAAIGHDYAASRAGAPGGP